MATNEVIRYEVEQMVTIEKEIYETLEQTKTVMDSISLKMDWSNEVPKNIYKTIKEDHNKLVEQLGGNIRRGQSLTMRDFGGALTAINQQAVLLSLKVNTENEKRLLASYPILRSFLKSIGQMFLRNQYADLFEERYRI